MLIDPHNPHAPPEEPHNITEQEVGEYREQDRYLPIANVARIMKAAIPENAKIAKDAKECLQECVSELISFITSEAAEKCFMEKRKTIGGEDILYAMTSLGFDDYEATLKIYLAKLRQHQAAAAQGAHQVEEEHHSHDNTRRVQKELQDIQKNPILGLVVETEEENILIWNCAIMAHDESPYKKGTFKFKVELPQDYPFKPPIVTFLTKIYHPGINEEGHICLPMLRDEWKPGASMSTVLSTISEKVNNPSPDDPYEPTIAAQLKDNKPEFLATAQEWTKQHAMS